MMEKNQNHNISEYLDKIFLRIMYQNHPNLL